MVTVPSFMLNTLLVLPPLIDKMDAPGPLITRFFLVILSSPLVSVIVPFRFLANVIASPSLARAIASRSDPGPWSFKLVTLRDAKRIKYPGKQTEHKKSPRTSAQDRSSVVCAFPLRP